MLGNQKIAKWPVFIAFVLNVTSTGYYAVDSISVGPGLGWGPNKESGVLIYKFYHMIYRLENFANRGVLIENSDFPRKVGKPDWKPENSSDQKTKYVIYNRL